jgi:hypothetical protein
MNKYISILEFTLRYYSNKTIVKVIVEPLDLTIQRCDGNSASVGC